jgi:hypothetical protein
MTIGHPFPAADGAASSGELLPWGVQAVWNGDDPSRYGNPGVGRYAFVIDGGVADTTGDLTLNTTWSRSWVAGRSAFSDPSGHGTHVAGTIAALANGQGVVGVAAGAEVISLRIFDDGGRVASYQVIVEAVNYAVAVITANGIPVERAVVNLSFGGVPDAALAAAIRSAADLGIRLVIAAGNQGIDADGVGPANSGDHPNVFTVSAVDATNTMPAWSNVDNPDADPLDDVDLAAPGVAVLSLAPDGSLVRANGTSMAAAHVSGLLLVGAIEAGPLATAPAGRQADPFALRASAPPLELWGTVAADRIVGGAGADRLSGVTRAGTSAAQLGKGQIDRLIGAAGADVFVLGDARGIFYNDRLAANVGRGDYARILDFTPGDDRLQLRRAAYLPVVANGTTSLYWDRNANGRLNTTGAQRDELIAVIPGAAITAADWILV